jgi:hypothetical protein
MDTDMTDPENDTRCEQKRIAAIYRDEQYRDDRQRGSGDGDPYYAAVEILHGFFASKIAYPEYLVQDHQYQCGCKPQYPPRRADVEIAEYENDPADKDFTDAFKR